MKPGNVSDGIIFFSVVWENLRNRAYPGIVEIDVIPDIPVAQTPSYCQSVRIKGMSTETGVIGSVKLLEFGILADHAKNSFRSG